PNHLPLLSPLPPHPIAAAAAGDGDPDGRHRLRPLSPRGRLLPWRGHRYRGRRRLLRARLLPRARPPPHPRRRRRPPDSGEDDSEDDSDEDDDENCGRAAPAKRAAGRKRTGLRLLFWSRNVVTKSDSAREAERAQAQAASAPLEIENLAKIIEDFKMVLVVRNDLKMGKGKIAAQCSHATLGLFKKLQQRAPKSLRRWERCGQVKVVVKVESEEDMLVLQGRAKSMNLPTHITIDAGRTQIAPNSRTVMAIL
uniref:peptidyl-tRNA hydrolase n=1 Tax=Aegilops tauschii subsp. strangulata TaxID=200361 RepID=A0A453D779_AEGTS